MTNQIRMTNVKNGHWADVRFRYSSLVRDSDFVIRLFQEYAASITLYTVRTLLNPNFR
jgi:hypothetical protein